MKRVFAFGAVVILLSAAPSFAQQSRGGAGQPSPTGRQQPGSQGGSPGSPADPSNRGGGATTRPTQGGSSQASADRQFVMEAAHGGLAEVELGRLASQKAQSAQVKQFAQKMVEDHGKSNQELKTLAQGKNITVPTDLDTRHTSTKDRLEKLSGAEFDRAYMQQMVQDHQKTVADFRRESQSGQDSEVKAWAAKQLPTLEQHLQMAQQASRGAVGTSGTQSGSRGTTGATTGGSSPTTPRTGPGNVDDSSGGSTTGGRTSGGTTPGAGSGTGGTGTGTGSGTGRPGSTPGSGAGGSGTSGTGSGSGSGGGSTPR